MTLNERVTAMRNRDDSGAALILALVMITVVATTIAVLLSFANTSLKAGGALRGQAATAAGADGAAQLAINALRNGTYDGEDQCFGTSVTSGTLELKNFYQRASGAADSARVVCEQDPNTSVPSLAGTRPRHALLTLGTSAFETGIFVKANGGGGIRVQGDVGSRSTVTIDHGQLNVQGDLTARRACTGTIVVSGTRSCNDTNPPADPNHSPPVAPTGNGSISSCAARMVFQPGIYSSLSALNNAMNCHSVKVFDFRPGFYYFSYSGQWTIDNGTLVAGSVTPLTSTPPAIPGACPSQVDPVTPNPGAGVVFVFGGTARLNISRSAKVEICGRYSATAPPIAIYGLRSALGSGALRVPAQSGCVTSIFSRCAMIETDNQSSSTVFYIQGHTYVPAAWVDLDLRESTNQYFVDGLVARAFSVFAPASAVPPSPLASIPLTDLRPVRTVVRLAVYVCPGVPTCLSGSGSLRLRVKVGINDPTGFVVKGKREITVYSWSVQR